MRGRWLLASTALILLGVAAGALSLLRRDSVPKQAPVRLESPGPVARDLKLSGKLQAQKMIPVGTTVSGTIEVFLADVGQEVFEGQLLARIANQGLEAEQQEAARAAQTAQEKVSSIENRVIAARLEASRSRAEANRSRDQFQRAEKTYQRQQMLFREGATPRLVYEKAEREFETARSEFNSLDEIARQAEDRVSDLIKQQEAAAHGLAERNAELENARSSFSSAELHSPVSGFIVARNGQPGQSISLEEGKDLFEITTDISHLEVATEPDPDSLKRLRPAQSALVFVADLPGAIPGTLKEIKGSAAIFEFTSPSPVIRPGMPAQVHLTLE
jgi:multidrug resistance efflux pump